MKLSHEVKRMVALEALRAAKAERRIRQRQVNEAARGLERVNKHIDKLEAKIGQLAKP